MHCVGLNDDDDDDVITESAAVVRDEPPQDDKGPPKIDCEMEVLHEKVKKQVIKEGHGQQPAKFATCFCKCCMILLCLGH